MEYNFIDIEEKWQENWEQSSLFCVDENSKKPKYYILEMFPYPSGKIHMGHVRNYTIGDVSARYKRCRGFNVLHPMGWDAFGMPAENAAIKNKIHPREWTYKNIESMKKQLIRMGLSYDWSREIKTCDNDYFVHEQKFFLELYKEGLAYKKESFVNWDPVDKTVLANEQVIEGKGWRSGAVVEQKKLSQWFLKITDFAEDLLNGLNELENWPKKVLSMQENWIGKSIGATIKFQINNSENFIEVFTTRPDTIFGASFIGLSADHNISINLSKDNKEIFEFIKLCKQTGTTNIELEKAEKIGIDTGLTVKHPFTEKEIPVYIANFILLNYGTGAIFGCPAHDQRDFEFAKKYDLDIIRVIAKNVNDTEALEEAYTESGILTNSDVFDNINNEDAKIKIAEHLEKMNLGKRTTTYRLRDWLISRQRYWGTPIPIIYCGDCGTVPVPEKDLPVILPPDAEFKPTGESPLKYNPEFINCKCPNCGKNAERETDTMDTFVDSSWYFLRYPNPKHDNAPFDLNKLKLWNPVDQYTGGAEHAVLHLICLLYTSPSPRDRG